MKLLLQLVSLLSEDLVHRRLPDQPLSGHPSLLAARACAGGSRVDEERMNGSGEERRRKCSVLATCCHVNVLLLLLLILMGRMQLRAG